MILFIYLFLNTTIVQLQSSMKIMYILGVLHKNITYLADLRTTFCLNIE